MIATKNSFERHTSESRTAGPNSKRIYLQGRLHPDVRVSMREIELAPTKSYTGRIEVNEPVRVYDCSGPWGDPDFHGDVEHGLPALRAKWIRDRGDVEEYDGRELKPIDDGYLSEKHRGLARAKRQDKTPFHLDKTVLPKRKILRAKSGRVVTQLAYARAGIITLEMEFIAIRENMSVAQTSGLCAYKKHRLEACATSRATTCTNSTPAPTNFHALRITIRRFNDLTIQRPPFSTASPNAFRMKSPPNSSAPKLPPGAPSSRPTSITRNPSR